MRETAFAKINLALHVRGREPDGYHRLETVFAFAEEGDELEVAESERAGELELVVTGPFAKALFTAGGGSGEGARTARLTTDIDPPHPSRLPAGERGLSDNLVIRAAEALREHYGVTKGARLTLDKRLPVAAGIGGGSADAAAALRLLTPFWNLPNEPEVLHAIARTLGADVPACLASRTVRGEGRGDDLVPVDGSALAGTPVLLVNPGVPVPTGPVFKAWAGVDRGPLDADLIGRNDLETPARTIAPVIGDVLEALAGARFAQMSGSGATCFALYDSEAERDEAQARICAAHPNWWTLASRLRR
ncbi:4-(cytidine 5'-diphospho)-2-C-methyl-D-erythritol kinase [Sphingosinicella sp. YJ22]|uniref:4-(cytidine 5'-diphospho)-2-C-methyl-D-erythritol kinase n=1 Tax=Sphingosinicella sp. YJ22 TaxID=1104780 RepID=UPI001FB02F8D|nr:4-(cytidine 5'-diphospho)-2-C-methyl-D-erythritol kinase [Sphingosinicella sp. YJ22]